MDTQGDFLLGLDPSTLFCFAFLLGQLCGLFDGAALGLDRRACRGLTVLHALCDGLGVPFEGEGSVEAVEVQYEVFSGSVPSLNLSFFFPETDHPTVGDLVVTTLLATRYEPLFLVVRLHICRCLKQVLDIEIVRSLPIRYRQAILECRLAAVVVRAGVNLTETVHRAGVAVQTAVDFALGTDPSDVVSTHPFERR